MGLLRYIELSKSITDIFPRWNDANDHVKIQWILNGYKNRPGDRNILSTFLDTYSPVPKFSDDVYGGKYNYIRLNRTNVLTDFSNWDQLNSDYTRGYLILNGLKSRGGDRLGINHLLQSNTHIVNLMSRKDKMRQESWLDYGGGGQGQEVVPPIGDEPDFDQKAAQDFEDMRTKVLFVPSISSLVPGSSSYSHISNTSQYVGVSPSNETNETDETDEDGSTAYVRMKPPSQTYSSVSTEYVRMKASVASKEYITPELSINNRVSLLSFGSNEILLDSEYTDPRVLSTATRKYVCSIFNVNNTTNKKRQEYVLMTDGYYGYNTPKLKYKNGNINNHLVIRLKEDKNGKHAIQIKAIDNLFQNKYIENLYFTVNTKKNVILDSSNHVIDTSSERNVLISLVNSDVDGIKQVYRWKNIQTNLKLCKYTLNTISNEFRDIIRYGVEEDVNVKLGTDGLIINKQLTGHNNIGRTQEYIGRLMGITGSGNDLKKEYIFLFKEGYNHTGSVYDMLLPYKNGSLESCLSIEISDGKSIKIRSKCIEFIDKYIETLFFTISGGMDGLLESSHQSKDTDISNFITGSISIKLISDDNYGFEKKVYRWQNTQTNLKLYEYSVNKLTSEYKEILYLG